MPQPDAQEILDFWFEDCVAHPGRIAERAEFWFEASNQSTDALIRQRFGHQIERASTGRLFEWVVEPRGRLALIILLDQFRRNVFRGTAQAFERDPLALFLAESALQLGQPVDLALIERASLFMPFQHAEALEAQEQSVRLYEQLLEVAPAMEAMTLKNFAASANLHRDIIRRFGRFPHRNAALTRMSTPEELEYLATHPENFGQNAKS